MRRRKQPRADLGKTEEGSGGTAKMPNEENEWGELG